MEFLKDWALFSVVSFVALNCLLTAVFAGLAFVFWELPPFDLSEILFGVRILAAGSIFAGFINALSE